MPPKNSYELSSGTMFFMNDDSKWEPLCPVKEVELEEEAWAEDCYTIPIITNASGEFIGSFTVARRDWQKWWLSCCPNCRIVHLAKHAKKARIREKNFKRVVKITMKKFLNGEEKRWN